MKCWVLLFITMGLTLNHGASDLIKGTNPDNEITMHLHRLTARYELNPKAFDHDLYSLSVTTLFDSAEKNGDLSRMSLIIAFFKDEDIIPKGFGDLRGRLFQNLTSSKLQYPHLRMAFKGN